MRFLITFLCFLLIGFSVVAQTPKQVKGILQDSTGQSVISASIKLISATDSLITNSNLDGSFNFNQIKGDQFKLTVTSLGYESKILSFQFNGKTDLNLGKIIINESSELLQTVTIDGTPLITIKEDTLEYRTKDYKLKDGAVTEDLLKKLDGVEVDRDGNVTAQGEKVSRVRINGKDFFGGDVQTATKNLPADVIEKIQIIDDYGDQANLTGNKTGDPERILNIEIAPSKNKGDFGQFRVGGGTEERYQITGMYNSFAETRQFSSLANLNNTNASLFDFNTQGSGARRRRGGGGGSALSGGGSGLTTTGSIGLNYRKSFMKDKITTYGSYSFSHIDNKTLSNSFNQYLYPDTLLVDKNNRDQNSIGNNHRLDWNLEYKIDDKNYLKLSPFFSLNNSNSSSIQNSEISANDELTDKVEKNNISDSKSPNIGISGLYNHRFNDKGRNIFVNFSLNTASTESDREEITDGYTFGATQSYDYLHQLIDLNNKRLNGGTSFSYLEPIGEHSNLELEYKYDFSNYDNSRITNNILLDGEISYDPILSNTYDYSFRTSNINLNYRYRKDKINYTIGASVQPSTLKGNTEINNETFVYKRNATHFAPVARFEYRFSRTKRLSLNYSGRPNEPSYSQLQPVTDMSDPRFRVRGNPNLKAEFSHNLRLRYNNFNNSSGNSFFAMLNGTLTNDKVVTDRTQEKGLQTTSYLNADGFYSMRGFYNYSKPFLNRKYVASLNGSANLTNNISYTKNAENPSHEENIAKNWILTQGLNVKINPNEWLETTPGIRYSYNATKNSLNNQNNRNINTWSMDLSSKIYFIPTLVWSLDLSKMSNSGYSGSIDANPLIINTYLEKQFLKGNKGAIRLQVYDLLNEQVNITRNVTENSILDSRSNRLARYFMLTLSYRFQKFAGSSSSNVSDQDNRPNEGRSLRRSNESFRGRP